MEEERISMVYDVKSEDTYESMKNQAWYRIKWKWKCCKGHALRQELIFVTNTILLNKY